MTRSDTVDQVVLQEINRRRQAELNERIEEGLAQLDRGEGIPGDQTFHALWEKSRRRRARPTQS